MKLTDRVYVVGRSGWGGLPPLSAGIGANVFLLDGGAELALVDVGMPEGVDDILRNIRADGFDPARVRTMLLTHAHYDHAAATADFVTRLGATVYGHALARETLGDGPGIYLPEFRLPQQYPGPVHQTLGEGDEVRVGDVTLRAVHVPGHTPDGLAYVFDTPAGPQAFTGDTAIGDQPQDDGTTAEGVVGWIEYVWRSSLRDFASSLRRLRDLNLHAMYPGHGHAHVGAAEVRRSLDHCVARLDQFMSIPALGSMIPER